MLSPSAPQSSKRLLNDGVLAGLKRQQGPIDVSVVGRRNIHDINVGVGDQVLIAGVSPLDPESTSEQVSRVGAARAHGDDLLAGVSLQGADECLGYPAGTHDAPPQGGCATGVGRACGGEGVWECAHRVRLTISYMQLER